ncbi:MAG: hypothetical protein AB8B77_08300 [Alphaproteobacteria bacterium]
MKFLSPIILFAGMLLLASCESAPPERMGKLICPQILIPKYTENLVKFAPDALGTDITDIDFEAGVGYLSGECTINQNLIVMNFPVLVEARKGAANVDNIARTTLFAAVMNNRRERLTQIALPYILQFRNNNPVASLSDPITIEIPKRPNQTGNDFVIYLGIELQPQEIAYNRNQQ